VYHKVSRARTELNIFALDPIFVRWNAQLVAGASPSVNKRHAERRVNLSAQAINVDFYEFRERVERIVPNVLGDFFASDNLARVAREIFKQRVLFSGEFDGLPVAPDSLPRVSISRSPTSMIVGRNSCPRRRSARKRARSSPNSKGFVR
jgi:hypothetical protein